MIGLISENALTIFESQKRISESIKLAFKKSDLTATCAKYAEGWVAVAPRGGGARGEERGRERERESRE